MTHSENTARLGVMLRAKRKTEGLKLRHVTEQTGISASTLSRIERGAGLPDRETIIKLSHWLNISVGDLLLDEKLPNGAAQELSTPERITALLRADRRLSAEAATVMSEMFGQIYDAVAEKKR